MASTPATLVPIANHYLHAIIAGPIRQGWKAQQLLQHTGIPVELLNSTTSPISAQQLSDLMRNVWRLTDDENMGCSAQRIPYGSFALMLDLVIHCKTLGGMLKQAVRFCTVLRRDLDIGISLKNDQLVLTLSLKQVELDPDHSLQELLLLTWQRLISWLVGYKVMPTTTFFNYVQPDHVSEYPLMYGPQLEFDQPTSGFSISDRLLKLPITRSDADLKNYLDNFPANILRRPRQTDTLTQQLQQLLMQHDMHEFPTLAMVADQLHLTPRTLRRKLAQEGVRFRQFKDQIRRDKAIRLLTREHLSINQVSQQTGFAEPAAFCKAFKKWTGVQPSAYRSRLQH